MKDLKTSTVLIVLLLMIFPAVSFLGCGCGKDSKGGGAPPPIETPQPSDDQAKGSGQANAATANLQAGQEVLGAEKVKAAPKKVEAVKKQTGGGAATAATKPDSPGEGFAKFPRGGAGGAGSGLPGGPNTPALGGAPTVTDSKTDAGASSSTAKSADLDASKEKDGLAADAGGILGKGGGPSFESTGKSAGGGTKKGGLGGLFGKGAGGGMGGGGSGGGADQANFGVGGGSGPGRTSDTGDVTGGAEGDLDAYLNQVGTTSLFEIVNKRMDKYSSNVYLQEQKDEMEKISQ